MTRHFSRLLPALALLWYFPAVSSAADHEHSANEFEVFLAAEAIHGTGQTHAGDDDTWFDADVLFGLTEHQFKVFGEYYITPDERDLERLQFGWEFAPETTLWFGRFHQPASAWNSEHHHGRYLQTAITRPFIERWEDEQGLIPQHITGALFDTRQAMGNVGAIQVSTGVGYGPSILAHEYEPIDLIDNNPGRHRLAISGRLAYLPEYESGNGAGLVFAHDQVQTASPSVINYIQSTNIVLTVWGAYVDWTFDPWRVIATNYYVDVGLDTGAHDESFISGYIQAERVLPHKLTMFGRLENSSRMEESRYVHLFDDHDGDIDIAFQREALGLRWDFIRRQALTVEISHVISIDQRSNEIRLQWSGVIP
ncbi:MAG TPA: hypothetical protein VGI93_16095 [Steroidobacteraceae bacterium]|jgi:hypothetical protein